MMAENVKETKPPEPPPKPPEVPKPTEQSNRSEARDQGRSHESQQSAQQDARNAVQSEHAKATDGRGPDGLRPTPEVQARWDEHSAAKNEREGLRPTPEVPERPAGEQAGDHAAVRRAAAVERSKATEGAVTAAEGGNPRSTQEANQPAPDNGQARDPARVAQPAEGGRTGEQVKASPPEESAAAQQADQDGAPQAAGERGAPAEKEARSPAESAPEENTETDRSAETAARLNELRNQGHGPQRHHDPTDAQLAARMGDPILDPQSGEPLLNDKGHVRAQNHVDPMTGTTVDGVHGGVHRCGDYATRIDSPEDYVAADRYLREQIGDTGPASVRRPISEVLGPNAHERMTGYYHDPHAPGHLKPVDFTDGTVFAMYERLPNGELNLRTMYVDPAPPNPDQLGGTG